jgi:pimeloyl-ACP methyl ester carboxylesterase
MTPTDDVPTLAEPKAFAQPYDGHGPVSRIFFSQRLRLHYVDWGNASAQPLVLVHGGRDHCRNWDWVAERLSQRYHVIAPDLRGHGDSQWVSDGHYAMSGFVHDLAQLIHSQGLSPVTLIGHSLGGNIVLRYAGAYPENITKLIAIEGLGPSPKMMAERATVKGPTKLRNWIESNRAQAGRQPKRYASLEQAFARMQEENKHLTPAQAMHLTRHGVNQNEDGSYSWKFDHYVRQFPIEGMTHQEIEEIWANITCPTLLIYGKESWASNPARDGRAAVFQNAQVDEIDGAGHWVHHDKLDAFMALVDRHLAA